MIRYLLFFNHPGANDSCRKFFNMISEFLAINYIFINAQYYEYYKFSMQLATKFNQNSSDDVAIKDIAQLQIKICENTEYLTNIFRHQQGRVFKVYTPDFPNIQLKSFYNLIVQSAFLLYTCCIKKVALYFSKNLFIAFQKEGAVQVIRQFIFQAEYLNMDQKKQKFIDNNFIYVNTFKHQNAYSQHVLEFIRSYISIVDDYNKKEKTIKDKKNSPEKAQLESLRNASTLLSGVLQKNIKAKILISCLEETQLFRTYSYLLKTLNCSIYEAIRKTGKMDEILCDIKRKEINLLEGFNYMVQQNPIVFQTLQNSVEEFIKYLIRMGIIEMEISFNNSGSNSYDSNKEKNNNKIGTLQVHKNGDRVYSWKILVEQKKLRQINKKTIMDLTQGQTTQLSSSQDTKDPKRHQNLFYIEYMSNKNLINVWYISNIEVNIENSDALIYHCNNLTMQINNLTVDYTERQSNKTHKRKQKVLAFKVITHFNIKQNPYINILLLIDRAMIYGKVCQPEISKKTSKSEDYSRFNTVGKRINHLSNLFIKKIRRSYENVMIKSHEN